MMYHNDPYLNDFENRIESARQRENEPFDLQPPEGYESGEDSLGDLETNGSIEIDIEDSRDWDLDDDDDDGQPTEYEEWQDVNGGDDWDHGQYDCMDY